MKNVSILSVLLMVMSLGAGRVVADTDFSGTWKLNAEKSERGATGGRGGQTASEITVAQSPDAITVNAGQREIVYKPAAGPQELSGGRLTGTQEARWDGERLVIEQRLETQRGALKSTITWTLSPDGKVLTQSIQRDTPRGAMQQKLVYERQ